MVVQNGFAHIAPSNRLGQRRAEEARRPGHLQVEPGHGPGDGVVGGFPVGHQDAVPGPLALQDPAHERAVVRAMNAVHPVVGGHHRPRPGVHGRLERDEVDLAQGPLVDPAVDRGSVRLRLVGDVVLRGGGHSRRLHSLDVGGAEQGGQHGVLGVGLEVAAAQRRADQVEHRPQHVVDAGSLCFQADPGGDLAH